jgi:cysteine desulfuration protein SufE
MIEKIIARGEELKTLEGQDRLQYLVDLAREVPPLSDNEKVDENKIRGCASNLWVVGEKNKDNIMSYKHDGDAFITKGTAKIILDIVNGEKADNISKLTLEDFKHLGIRELLTMQRQVGFASLIERVIRIADV